MKTDKEVIIECSENIIKLQKIISSIRDLIIINENRDKYGRCEYLTDNNEIFNNIISDCEYKIKDLLFKKYNLESNIYAKT